MVGDGKRVEVAASALRRALLHPGLMIPLRCFPAAKNSV
jgi:hypothetical protein